MPVAVIVRRGATSQTPSITSLEEGEAGILNDMMGHLPQVPDTPIAGSQRIHFMEPICQASTPMVEGNVPHKIEMSYVEPGPVKTVEAPVYHPGPRPVPRPRKSLSAVKHMWRHIASCKCLMLDH